MHSPGYFASFSHDREKVIHMRKRKRKEAKKRKRTKTVKGKFNSSTKRARNKRKSCKFSFMHELFRIVCYFSNLKKIVKNNMTLVNV
jgi:hypothetical protein